MNDPRDVLIETTTTISAARREKSFSTQRAQALRLCAAALQAAAKARRPIDEGEVVTIEGRRYTIADILDKANDALSRPVLTAMDAGQFRVSLDHIFGGEEAYLTREEFARYERDPDGWAAEHFGFKTAGEYREWVETAGTPLCGERTRSGKMCRCIVGRIQMDPGEWLAKHRASACHVHDRSGAGG